MNLLDIPGGREEEGLYISPYVSELMDYLDDCLTKLEEGRENEIASDPFCTFGLSDARVDQLIAAIDEKCANEIGQYPGYHRNRQGCNAAPEYLRMGASARRAMAEGCLAIIRRYEASAE